MPELNQTIQRYLKSKSKGTGENGTYRASAESALTIWAKWLIQNGHTDLDALNDPSNGSLIIRRYAQYLDDRVAQGEIVASTAQNYYTIISGFLSYAVRDGLLDRNPALTDSASEPLREPSGQRDQQFWSPEVRKQLLDHADEQIIHSDANEFVYAMRNRALAYTLAYTAVRGSEVFKSHKDDREGRRGLRWRNVDIDSGTLRVLGKSQEWEWAPIPEQARNPIAEYWEEYNPASDDWPVFPTAHNPSKYNSALEGLTTDEDAGGQGLQTEEAKEILRDHSPEYVFREYDINPPALTVDGAREVLKRLSEDADVHIDGDYLKPHGARRGIGDRIYREDRGLAQDLLRHRSLNVTDDAYSHITAEETGDDVSEILNLLNN